LYKPLSKLFQISLLHSYFPVVCKESFIKSLHKKGRKSDIKNYRGIAKQSAINKCIDPLSYSTNAAQQRPQFDMAL